MSPAEARFLPGSDVNVPHNVRVTSSEFVYYRVYHKDHAIATKRPAYLNDKYIGRIRSKWVSPPHTAGSLKRYLSTMENIDPNKTKLLASVANQSALGDEAPISLKSNQTFGIIPKDPVILFLEAMPEYGMQPGTESFYVAPDRESPLPPRFLFYGVYTEVGAKASIDPIDAGHPWVSKFDLDSILPPVSVPWLLHILNMKEGINTSPQLLAQDGLTPLGDDQIVFTKDGNWLGASAEDHLVLKFGRPSFAEGSPYWIQNLRTGNLLALPRSRYANLEIHSAKSRDGPQKHFTPVFLVGGTVNLGDVVWFSPHHGSYQYGPSFYFIPSTTKKNYFFICDLVSRKAFYDTGASDAARPYPLELREWDTRDTRQMWSLIPVPVPAPNRSIFSKIMSRA